MAKDEVDQLLLTDYYQRSALNIEEFYKRRFSTELEELERQLDYLQTASTVRTEQQSHVLNRLVLVLTIVSAILAFVQVLSITGLGNNDWALLTIMVVLTIVALVIVPFIVSQRLKHKGRQYSSTRTGN